MTDYTPIFETLVSAAVILVLIAIAWIIRMLEEISREEERIRVIEDKIDAVMKKIIEIKNR